MVVKTALTPDEFANTLSLYDVEAYTESEAIQQGTVQTNYVIRTTQGKTGGSP